MRIVRIDELVRRDARGWALDTLRAAGVDAGALGDLHVVSVEPGSVRGNHLHPDVTEWMLVCGGPATIAWRDARGEEGRERVGPEAPVLAEFGPGEAHAVRSDGPGVVFVVCCSDGVPTTERVPVLL